VKTVPHYLTANVSGYLNNYWGHKIIADEFTSELSAYINSLDNHRNNKACSVFRSLIPAIGQFY